MNIGYIREYKGSLSRAQQKKIILGADSGIEFFMYDGEEGESLAANADEFGNGDVFYIVSAAVLGHTRHHLIAAVTAIGRHKASIYDIEEKELIHIDSSTIGVFRLADRAENEIRKRIVANARASKSVLGVPGGAPKRITEKRLKRAKTLWSDPGKSGQTVSRLTGISISTLYRMFGPKSRSPSSDAEIVRPVRGRPKKIAVVATDSRSSV